MLSGAEPLPRGKNPHYPILDALRFLLAFWVTMGHVGVFPLFYWAKESTALGRTLIHGWSSIVFGTPAVIGFFVISGFCIHLPFRNGETLVVGRYYLRRYTRILIPLVASLLVVRYVAERPIQLLGEDSILWHSVLWSLLCEEIYYAAYPVLRQLRNRFGWAVVLSIAFPVGAGAAATHRYAGDWHLYGPFGTALILLPVWLLGCLLAEQAESLAPVTSSFAIWKWRFLCWAGSWVCEMLHFKAKISYTHTMLWFGVLCYFWIKNEIAYSRQKSPWGTLAAAGAWSYSLYLVHQPAIEILYRFFVPNFGAIANWIAIVTCSLAFSYVFYLCVERPSHKMARRVSLTPKSSKLLKDRAYQSSPV